MSNFNELADAETERLALLMEEMGEAIQMVGKILRHGYESFDPNIPRHQTMTNRQYLELELGDVRQAMILLCDAGDLNKETIHYHADRKAKSVEQYLHHQNEKPPNEGGL
jgi:hypothetical protein